MADLLSEQNDRFVLDVLSNGMVFVYKLARKANDRTEPFKARILAGDISVGGNSVNIVDRVIVPRELEGKLLVSRAHRKTDVEELEAVANSKFMANWVMSEMLKQTESLDEDAAVPIYHFGLRLLEDVLPVSRKGVMIMEMSETNDPTILRARLRARLDDLDRVWYGMLMKNTPSTTSLMLRSKWPFPRSRHRPQARCPPRGLQ